MRRFVILFLLVLLPIEVLAGISYEQRLALEAQQEAAEHHARSPASGDPAVDARLLPAQADERAGRPDAPVAATPAQPEKHQAFQVPAQDICLPTLAYDIGESDFSLDLGEAFDVPCQSVRKPTRRVASSPVHTGFCDKSIVAAVPTRPAI